MQAAGCSCPMHPRENQCTCMPRDWGGSVYQGCWVSGCQVFSVIFIVAAFVCGCACVYVNACVHMRITYCGEVTYQSKVSSSNTLNPTDSWLCFCIHIVLCI